MLQAATTDALCGERQEPEFSFLPLQMKNLIITMWAISCVSICELFPNRPLDVSSKMTKTTNRKSKKICSLAVLFQNYGINALASILLQLCSK